jgi:hypothetical protein
VTHTPVNPERVALALLVAESRPEQKTLMVKLVEHFVLLADAHDTASR